MTHTHHRTENKEGRVLIFDTEATGLPTFRGDRLNGDLRYYGYNDLAKYESSRVVQLSYVVREADGTEIKEVDHIIKPDNFTIPQHTIDIHGITNEIAHAKGVDINKAFDELRDDLKGVTTIVGHHVYFDKNVLMAEAYRYGRFDVLDRLRLIHFVCTQELAKPICKFPGRYGIRLPGLADTHEFFFGERPAHPHNALYDARACARIYFHLKSLPPTPPAPPAPPVPASAQTPRPSRRIMVRGRRPGPYSRIPRKG